MARQLRVNESVEQRQPQLKIDPPVAAGSYTYELVVVDVLDVESAPESIVVRVS
jgi:hypothetical protein